MVIAAILAGGSGTRFGAQTPKQFLRIGGSPILLHCLRAFACSGLVDLCLVSVPAAFREDCARMIAAAALPESCPVRVIEGGDTRGGTLLKALCFLEAAGLLEGSVLLTHDAVRPFVTKKMIADNIAAAKASGACNTCVPATDTVFLSGDGAFIDSVPDRRTVFHAQTPQTFRAAELLALCRQIPPAAFEAMTDGCSVYAYFHKKVALVPGDRDNIKITYPEDLARAEEILLRRMNREKNIAEGEEKKCPN